MSMFGTAPRRADDALVENGLAVGQEWRELGLVKRTLLRSIAPELAEQAARAASAVRAVERAGRR